MLGWQSERGRTAQDTSQMQRTRTDFGFHPAGDKSLPKQPRSPQKKDCTGTANLANYCRPGSKASEGFSHKDAQRSWQPNDAAKTGRKKQPSIAGWNCSFLTKQVAPVELSGMAKIARTHQVHHGPIRLMLVGLVLLNQVFNDLILWRVRRDKNTTTVCQP